MLITVPCLLPAVRIWQAIQPHQKHKTKVHPSQKWKSRSKPRITE
jgi:hypothetical protein